ncbi:2',5'-phosphodiesterase 12 [Belonocnema kinseyi]|uniref:2',5'-phosphodiesterase 12 n=1 Tax=Belonocnema kinseyi TaxID=2817044 RepID=UPI00143D5F24|nr:2',5'-phosphodiesterase 12 [Belonocnema kinseyi]
MNIIMSLRILQTWYTRKEFLTSTLFTSTKLIQTLKLKSTQPAYIYNMNEAYLRFDKGQENFEFTFRYVNPECKIDRQFNFNRKSAEPVSVFLKRVDNNVTKVVEKKKSKLKRKQKAKGVTSEEPEEEKEPENSGDAVIKVALLENESVVENHLPCGSVFENVLDLTLLLIGEKYSIRKNVPWVEEISLPKSILVGFPTYPSKFSSIYTNLKDSKFIWYKNLISDSPRKQPKWVEIGNGYFYVPSAEDLGCQLKLSCIPGNENQTGPLIEVESQNLVEAGPGRCPFETRHAFTKDKLSGDSFRVMSYNLLADTYADSDYSRDVLYRYCPAYALHIDYRKQLILKEIIGFNSDIICLQEVDNKVYNADLYPTLSVLNYDGVYNRKGAEVVEGLSTFFNKERYEKLNFESTIISENLELEKFKPVWERIQNEKTKTRFMERNTAVQATTLKSKDNPSEILVVGNTHLYFHPNADHIRLLQGFYVVTYISDVARRTKEEHPDCNVSIILCGDFNSVPECGIYRLMTSKFVPDDFIDWNSFPEEAVTGVSLSQDITFASACGTPEYTNYTADFSGCLDYIYYERDQLEVRQVIPMPTTEELALYEAIPSVVFPSDHLSLCADLKWKKR